jgi:hypothetical protein
MGMRETDVFEPSNEAEANAIKALLEEHGIESRIVSFHDTAFDGIFQAHKGWGRIRIYEKDVEKAKGLIEEWQAAAPAVGKEAEEQPKTTEVEEAAEEKSGRPEARPAAFGGTLWVMWRYGGPPLLLGSVVLNAYLLFWYEPALRGGTHVERDANNKIIYVANYRPGEKNAYRYREYDPKGNPISESLDDNGDRRYERFVAYGKDGNVISRGFDKNADGRIEKSIFYRPDGSIQTVDIDKDADGRFETVKIYYRGTVVAVQSDKDNNGVYERTVSLHRSRTRAQLIDKDQDGFPEQVQCKGYDGRIVQINTLACVVNRKVK